MIQVPIELVPAVQKLIAKRAGYASPLNLTINNP
jgi:hypothetical protein